jgi:hypothetical protein
MFVALTAWRIAQIAYHTDEPLLSDDEFLIAIWGIVLCTILGPITVAFVVKRKGAEVLRGGWG